MLGAITGRITISPTDHQSAMTPAFPPIASSPGAFDAHSQVFANLRAPDGPRLAVCLREGILDVTAAAQSLRLTVPRDTDALLSGGPAQLDDCMAAAFSAGPEPWLLTESQALFAPAVTRPGKIVCVGLNYRQHARETGMGEPKAPPLFTKYNNALTHHGATVPTAGLPGNHFDYECELVIVIGKHCRNVSESAALDHVFGYCTGNDFSERNSQLNTTQWLAGKSSDGFAPLGPYLVGATLVGNPNALAIETSVNGEVRQSSNTADFIFNCQYLIAYISRLFPLEPGDIIFTGTPEGVVLGMPLDQQKWLRPGDTVVTTVEKIGSLQITVG